MIHRFIVTIGAESLELRETADVVQQGRGRVQCGPVQSLPGRDPRGQGVDAQGVVAFEDDVLPAPAQPVRILCRQADEAGAHAPQHIPVHQMPW